RFHLFIIIKIIIIIKIKVKNKIIISITTLLEGNMDMEDLSRWYIRLIRSRTWRESEDPEKLSAYQTLYYVLMKLILLLSPVVPHISEKIYQNLKTGEMPESIFMKSITVDEKYIDKTLEEEMGLVREIVDAIMRGRDRIKYTLRYPVWRIILPKSMEDIVNKYSYIIKEQGNVREIEVAEFQGSISVKPNYRELGKVFRSEVPKVVEAIKSIDPKTLKERLEKEGVVKVEGYEIKPEYVDFKMEIPENIVGIEFSRGVVYLDIKLTEDILKEGLMREIIRRIQAMRKDMDLDIEEWVNIKIKGISFDRNTLEYIEREVRGKFCENITPEHRKLWEIKTPDNKRYKVEIAIERCKGN
ncbi:MAG TPA: isoleucine--tRNA ligase, partial [Methanococcaceae archaeon]|nr:isoleucine--tRNA ligase [Methanococcaceae archaeon]